MTEERTYVSWKEASKDVISSRAMWRWLPNISAINKFGKIFKNKNKRRLEGEKIIYLTKITFKAKFHF